MSKTFRKDLTGRRFGRLTVLEFVPTENTHSYWKCRCDCGKYKVISSVGLKTGNTASCGCISAERAREFIKTYHHPTHNLSKTKLYGIWAAMKQRCYNEKCTAHKNYGARGITVCGEWRNDFQAFYDWAMANGYRAGLTIDRIDNDGRYEPSNCRWSDRKKQSRNRRSNIYVNYNNKTMCLKDASKISGIPTHVLYRRYRFGDRGEMLFRSVENQK